MAVKKSGRKARGGKKQAGETESESRLTPPEEGNGAQGRQPANNKDDGTLAVNTGELTLPQELIEEDDEKRIWFMRVDPAVLTILCLSLLFIAFIAYLILSGWEPPAPEIKIAK
ncbi:MAG: hypothetical protein QOF02_3064 [Blastocatellia bacterium]|jgi:hypothetical protein|nr:hypothetical protein [Blastocatellia bacterium]